MMKLNTGAEMPAVGMGCYMGGSGMPAETRKGMQGAIKADIRHFDTAAYYNNEGVVGDVIRESNIPREQFFVTTKLWNDRHKDVERAFEESLNKLNIGYIDLYLMHWPIAQQPATGHVDDSVSFVDTWKSMEKLLKTHAGKVRAIGVSNFSPQNLDILLKSAEVVPACNQVETHPYNPDPELLEYCQEKKIRVVAYTPIGKKNSPMLKDPDLDFIAKTIGNGTSPSQVILSWNVQRGVAVVPRSVKCVPSLVCRLTAARTTRCKTSRSSSSTTSRWTASTRSRTICAATCASTRASWTRRTTRCSVGPLSVSVRCARGLCLPSGWKENFAGIHKDFPKI